jgi:molybdopterin-guanine dinucleotide biosynthesis protein A
MTLLGAVLAGGQSSRMGRDKAGIEVHGVAMLDRVARAATEVVDRVVVLGSSRQGFETWPDVVDVAGPLAGLVTALSRMTEERVLLLAVDNAFVRAETLTRLASLSSELPVVPVDTDGVRQVTCAIYPKTLAAIALEEAQTGGSIQTLLDRVSFLPVTPDTWESWGEDGRSWLSIDTPQALQSALDRYR